MSEKEAKEIVNRIATRNVFCTLEEEPLKAFEMAENALEEIQQYRAIGTVEEVKSIVNLGIWGYKKGYAKAIDEFKEELLKYQDGNVDTFVWCSDINKIAEQMKAGNNTKSNKCYATTCDHNNIDNTCMFGDAGERKCCVKEGGIDG